MQTIISLQPATLASVIVPSRLYAGTDFKSAALTARVNAKVSADACAQFKRLGNNSADDSTHGDSALGDSNEPIGVKSQEAAKETSRESSQEMSAESSRETPEETLQEASQEAAQETLQETSRKIRPETSRQTVQETVGTIDFAMAEVSDAGDGVGGGATREKFYHVYDNDACYEFALRVTTADALASSTQKSGAQQHIDDDEVFDRLTEILTSVTIVPVRGAVLPQGQP